jgi:hypothetical protein
MSKATKTPLQALNNAFRRMPVVVEDINLFIKQLSDYIGNIEEKESEEYAKGQLTQFLNDTFYHNKNKINTKGRIDLAIYEDKTPIVIIECKRPKPNDPDMVTTNNLNAKAFHELILYYLRERIEHNNTNIKHLIATNMYEWFVFDERDFDKIIFGDTNLKKDYETFSRENKNTDHFYKSIAKVYLEKVKPSFNFTYFDLRNYKKYIDKEVDKDEEVKEENRSKIRSLYKFLSPHHLLKQPLANDSNTLNKDFYYELLHLIGLEETKEGTKKIITRKAKKERDEASLIENVIFNIEQTDRLRKLQNPSSLGASYEERLFSVSLELCITWIDRILFLKLLEAQLVRYHGGKNEYRFLNIKTIPDFDALKNVFFSVLAKKPTERNGKWKSLFNNTPYLNSSLFEPTSLEDDILGIESLDSHLELEIFRNTKLLKGNKKASGKLKTIEYIFQFLDAYNFASEGADEEQEDRKALINASVLGLIFEKINGYKDGSFFTPGFITMQMCNETIRRSVVAKFNAKYNWECQNVGDIYNHLKRNSKDILEYNNLINGLKFCDPAVGSGHFLVSTLNEIIAVKNELGILADTTGKILPIQVTVENDELMVLYNDNIFEYTVQKAKHPQSEIQRIQSSLFHEKELIIENCLFGVDINGNSVKICRLRLWIELLKNSYYTKESNYLDLETLPNIDINIKRGNSLIHRFDLSSDLSNVFKQQKFNYQTYRNAVESYKTAPSKKAKEDLLIFIRDIKEQFKTVFYNNDPLVGKLSLLRGQRELLNQDMDLFGKKIRDEKEVAIEKKRLDMSIAQTEQKIQDIKGNIIYRNAFEWRFEFPEVMNKDGYFIGFDGIIGNPPYMIISSESNELPYYNETYKTASGGKTNTYKMFIELGVMLLNNQGHLAYINPNTYLTSSDSLEVRKLLLDKTKLLNIEEFTEKDKVFEEVTQAVTILILRNYNKDNEGFPFKTEKQGVAECIQSDFLLNDKLVFLPINSVISRMKKQNLKFKDIVEGNQGEINVSTKKEFFTSKNTKDNLPLIRGNIVGAYRFVTDNEEFCPVKIDVRKHHKINRVIFQEVSNQYQQRRIKAHLIGSGYLCGHTSNYVYSNNSEIENKYILGLLNSKAIDYYFKYFNTTNHIPIGEIKNIPIPEATKDNQKQVVKIVDKILAKIEKDNDADISDLETELNTIIYSLFSFSNKEIKIIEGK